MALIPFAEWTPDLADVVSGMTVAKNVISKGNAYAPFYQLNPVTDAATDTLLGLGDGKSSGGTTFAFAGDSGKLYRNVSGTMTDVSKSGGYSTSADERFRFTAYGDRMIASNYSDAIQSYVMGTSSAFADLSGSAPRARSIATVRDFFVCGNVYESGDYPTRVRWSALGDPTNWTISTTTQSDYQDLYEGGEVRAVVGGEYGTVFLEDAIYRMTYVGAPIIFQFDQIASNRGLAARDAFASTGGTIFFLDRDGFYALTAQGIQPIGANKVDRFFWSDVNTSFLNKITCAVDPENKVVMWGYATRQSTTGTPDRILIFNWRDARWTYADIDHELLGQTPTTGYTLEQMDSIEASLDDHVTSFDSDLYKGGLILIAAAKDKKIQSFTGSALEATLETAESSLADNRRAMLRSIRPVVDGGTLSMQVAVRDRANDAFSFGASSPQNAAGFCPFRAEGRYHRARLSIAAGGTWSNAVGIEIDAVAGGIR